jgi:hypothetical protein
MRPTNSRREQPMGLNIQQRMHGPVHQAHPKFFVRDKAIHTSTLNFNPLSFTVLYSFTVQFYTFIHLYIQLPTILYYSISKNHFLPYQCMPREATNNVGLLQSYSTDRVSL